MCAKFGFLLGKTAVETVTMLKEAIKDKSVSKHKFIPTDEAGFEMEAFC